MERTIRKLQRERLAYEAVGDTDKATAINIRINRLKQKYKEFSKAAGLKERTERMNVDFDSNNSVKSVANSGESGIIKEESKKPITKITDKAIDSVPYVKVEGMTDSECATLQQQHKELLRYACDNNDSKEVAFIFESGFSSKTVVKGTTDETDLGTALLGKRNGTILLHNHPRNSSFSTTDLTTFLSSNEIKTMTIVKNNGTVEAITKTSSFNYENAKLLYSRLYKKLVKTGTESEMDKFVKKLLANEHLGVIHNES